MESQTRYIGYSPLLDVLRALAIFIVVLGHANFQLGQNGHYGVDVFFTLSGFLITTLLLEEWHKLGSISFSAFYVRRAFRLFPALIVLLGVACIYSNVFASPSYQVIINREIVASLFYFYNIAWLFWTDFVLLTHTWSLAVEEQFYFIWPSICGWLLYQGRRRMVFSLAILSFLVIVIAVAYFRAINSASLLTALVHEGICLGVVASLIRWFYPKVVSCNINLAWVAWILLIVIGVMPYNLPEFGGDKILIAILTIICIYGAVDTKVDLKRESVLWASIFYLGKISYSWYLWHVPVFKLFKWHVKLDPIFHFSGKIAVSLLLAILSYELIEKGMVSTGRRISNRIVFKGKG